MGSAEARGFPPRTVVLADGAGQFDAGRHASRWIHAERLAHKPDTFTDLKACRADSMPRRRTELRVRFDRILNRQAGFATPDRLPAPPRANKPALLMAPDRPGSQPRANGSENDMAPLIFRGWRCHCLWQVKDVSAMCDLYPHGSGQPVPVVLRWSFRGAHSGFRHFDEPTGAPGNGFWPTRSRPGGRSWPMPAERLVNRAPRANVQGNNSGRRFYV